MALWSNIVSQVGDKGDTLCKFGKCHSPRNISALIFSCHDDLNALKEKNSTTSYLDIRNDFSVLELASSPLQKVIKLNQVCVRWEEKMNLWSGEGCSVESAGDGALVGCECPFPSNGSFSFLYFVEIMSISISVFYAQLILGGISMLVLFLTLIFLITARACKVQSQLPPPLNRPDVIRHRFAMQFNLALSMFGFRFILFFMSAATELESRTLCFGIAAFFQFFFLATAIWLFNQSFSLYMKISDDFAMRLNYKKLTTAQLVIGWGIPLIMVAATIGGLKDDYINDNVFRNFIQTKIVNRNLTEVYIPYYDCAFNRSNKPLFVSTMVIIVIVMVADAAVTIRALSIIKRLSRERSYTSSSNPSHNSYKTKLHKLHHLKSMAKSLLVLLPVSTFPWLIYMLASIESEGVVLEIHAYTSWLQGVAVFIIFCVLNRVDREKITREWQRSSIRIRFQNILNCSQELVGSQVQQTATDNS